MFPTVGRAAFRGWMAQLRRRGEAVWPVLIVGANGEAGQLHRLLTEHPEQGLQVRGVVGEEAEAAEHVPDAPWLCDLDGLDWAVQASGVNGVIVAASALPPGELNDVVRRLVDAGLHVQLSSGLQGIGAHRLRAAPVAHEPLFYLEPLVLSAWQRTAKRVVDVGLASVILALALPFMLVVAAGIKLQDRGPVLFAQRRVGQAGRHFTLLKFRTMVVDAEARLEEVKGHNQRSGPLFKVARDPRVTAFGRFLRTTSIDELPQLLNVLRGEMSLVGPRPALPSEVAEFSDRLKQRDRVRPGLTGLWQVEARDKPSFWTYERLDLFYVENWSVGLDLSIVGGTTVAVIRRGFAAVRDLLPSRPAEQPLHVLE
jgi:exopolysaccharide biosynthesis polyprenyl glycosylphosphotransferase